MLSTLVSRLFPELCQESDVDTQPRETNTRKPEISPTDPLHLFALIKDLKRQ